MQETEKLAEIIGHGYDLSMDDAIEIEYLTTQVDYEVGCRALDAVRLIITDPVYRGEVPADYFDSE